MAPLFDRNKGLTLLDHVLRAAPTIDLNEEVREKLGSIPGPVIHCWRGVYVDLLTPEACREALNWVLGHWVDPDETKRFKDAVIGPGKMPTPTGRFCPVCDQPHHP